MDNTPQIRISMWGGPSSGKSAHAEALYNYIKFKFPALSVSYIREYATEWLNNNSVNRWINTPDIQYTFTENQVKREIKSDTDIMITDCPVPLCYYWAKEHPSLSKEKEDKLEKLATFWSNQYHLNLLLPPPGLLYPYQQTSIRPTEEDSVKHHNKITYLFNTLLPDHTKFIVDTSKIIITVEKVLSSLEKKGLLCRNVNMAMK